MTRKASSLGTVSSPVSIPLGKCNAANSLRRSCRWNRKAALQEASPSPWSRCSRSNEYLSGPTLYAIFARENGSAAPIMQAKPNLVTLAFQLQSCRNSSQLALELLELEERELLLLPELELSLQSGAGTAGSAADERSAKAMKRSLLMASMEVRGCSLPMDRGTREWLRELDARVAKSRY